MVVSREGAPFEFPGVGVSGDDSQLSMFDGASMRRTAWDAIGDVVPEVDEDLELTGRWADLLPSIPEGHNYQWHTDRRGGKALFGWRRHFWSFLLTLAKDQPSWPIQAQPGPASGPFHWDNRRLSMRELCRRQTLPDNVRVIGTRNAILKQIGNAVPSLLAEVVAREIRVQLLGLKAKRGAPKLLPVQRAPVPAANAMAPVPGKYNDLLGKHDAHPGTATAPARPCATPVARPQRSPRSSVTRCAEASTMAIAVHPRLAPEPSVPQSPSVWTPYR